MDEPKDAWYVLLGFALAWDFFSFWEGQEVFHSLPLIDLSLPVNPALKGA